MSFKSLNHIITDLKQTHWQEQQAFQRLLNGWTELVGPAVAAHTQPIRITPQRVLQVTTASGVWAQNLAFERLNLLAKINARFKLGLTDIFFSTSQWGQTPTRAFVPERGEAPDLSRIPDKNAAPATSPTQDATTAFEQWATTIQTRSQSFPLCPQCHCPTPQSELARDGLCMLCRARQSFVGHPRPPADPSANLAQECSPRKIKPLS
jgi:predicted nucleic acid-binding Zn ribbon protein